MAGLVATADDELGERLGFISNSTGGVLGPQDSYLLIRGIKTLGLRMEQINRNVDGIVKCYKAIHQFNKCSIQVLKVI